MKVRNMNEIFTQYLGDSQTRNWGYYSRNHCNNHHYGLWMVAGICGHVGRKWCWLADSDKEEYPTKHQDDELDEKNQRRNKQFEVEAPPPEGESLFRWTTMHDYFTYRRVVLTVRTALFCRGGSSNPAGFCWLNGLGKVKSAIDSVGGVDSLRSLSSCA